MTVVKFPTKDDNLEELIPLLDKAFSAIVEMSEHLEKLEASALELQQLFDEKVSALAHRLGGIENVPVEYLIYTSLDDKVIEAMERLQCKETT